MSGIRIQSDAPAEAREAFVSKIEPIKRAVSAAMADLEREGLRVSRAEFAKVGPKFAQAMTARVYENDGINQAAFFVNRIPYSAVFETGATIVGKPLLWLPLPTTPRMGGARPTPELWAKRFGPLGSGKSKSGTPLLFGKLPGEKKSRPLFFGKRQVTIPDKVDAVAAILSTAAQLPAMFDRHLKDD